VPETGNWRRFYDLEYRAYKAAIKTVSSSKETSVYSVVESCSAAYAGGFSSLRYSMNDLDYATTHQTNIALGAITAQTTLKILLQM
jgi:hypothetical protein